MKHKDSYIVGDYFIYDNRVCRLLEIFHGAWTGMKTFRVLIESWNKTGIHEKLIYYSDLPNMLSVPYHLDIKDFIKWEKADSNKKG